MGILNKLKSWFSKEEKPSKEKLDERNNQEERKEEVQEQSNLEHCVYCKALIDKEDKFKEIEGFKLHKRCFKRVTKAALQGENIKEMFK